jgi:hypothetical protein
VFIGGGFPNCLANKDFVFRGQPGERLADFREIIVLDNFPDAKVCLKFLSKLSNSSFTATDHIGRSYRRAEVQQGTISTNCYRRAYVGRQLSSTTIRTFTESRQKCKMVNLLFIQFIFSIE